MKFFKFDHSEGAEIIASNNAKEAIVFYFTHYQDDSNTNDIIEFGGIKIEELKGDSITKKHVIYNEEKNEREEVSYKEIADEHFEGHPLLLVTPNY